MWGGQLFLWVVPVPCHARLQGYSSSGDPVGRRGWPGWCRAEADGARRLAHIAYHMFLEGPSVCRLAHSRAQEVCPGPVTCHIAHVSCVSAGTPDSGCGPWDLAASLNTGWMCLPFVHSLYSFFKKLFIIIHSLYSHLDFCKLNNENIKSHIHQWAACNGFLHGPGCDVRICRLCTSGLHDINFLVLSWFAQPQAPVCHPDVRPFT